MKWMLVVLMIMSLGCCEAGLLDLNTFPTNIVQSFQDMITDWLDTTLHPLIELIPSDMNFLNSLTTSPDEPWNSTSGSGTRKECRTLSDDERTRLFAAFNWLMTNKTSSMSMYTRYQVFATQHRSASAPSAHGGPCFPTWHRIFITRFENALRLFDKTVRLCYWDTSLDEPLPSAADSAVWTPEYYGENTGDVTTGFCANSAVPLTMTVDCLMSLSMKISRQVDVGNSNLFTQAKINAVFANMHGYTPLMTPYSGCNFEILHGTPHTYVGGQMSIISCSPLDGLFWLHHTYIDYLFELFRRYHQTTNKETDYPTDSGVPANHHMNDTMSPFTDIVCGGGLSENIVPRLYTYAPSPSNCTTHADCGGKTLWCNGVKCTACVKEGGQMGSNWPDRACYIKDCATPKRAAGTNLCTCSA